MKTKLNRRSAIKLGVLAGIIGATPFLLPRRKIENPYLDCFNKLPNSFKRSGALINDPLNRSTPPEVKSERARLVHAYSWAVPTEDAIRAISKFSRRDGLVDFGAGTGYWAHLLKQSGTDVVAVDNWSTEHPSKLFSPVITGSFDRLPENRDRALLMVWPLGMRNEMASRALDAWDGNKLVYVGEQTFIRGTSRATANPRFLDAIHDGWRLVGTETLPQWFNQDDGVFLYERKPSPFFI